MNDNLQKNNYLCPQNIMETDRLPAYKDKGNGKTEDIICQ